MRKIGLIFTALIALSASFFYGVGVGIYQLPPFKTIQQAKNTFFPKSPHANEEAFFQSMFTEELVKDVPLLNPPLPHNWDAIANAVEKEMGTIHTEQYFTAFHKLQIGEPEYVDDIIAIPYELGTQKGTAYAYLIPGKSTKIGSLIIPGSGSNQASAIKYQRGYHGPITDLTTQYSDTFIQIKPNHDSRALHNGTGRLSSIYTVVTLLRKGSCYSTSYLIEALALAKYIQKNYDHSAILGLSQGGEAALFTALQAEPSFALIASGFSVYSWQMASANSEQIHTPDLYQHFSLSEIKRRINEQKTTYYFSFGEQEKGIYGIDATKESTKKFLENNSLHPIFYSLHPAGHTFDESQVSQAFYNTYYIANN